jgi:glyoxylase-like metal-dependent hydrolase (beta-lactamase superfamily II)
MSRISPASHVHTALGIREIVPDVHCLGPNGRTQTNVFFVAAGSSWVLVDAGWAKDGPAIKEAAEVLFGTGSRPDAILLTHVHPDHSGSALELARAWDCPVYVHPDELGQANGDFAALAAGGGPLDNWLILPIMRLFGRRRRERILARSSLSGVVRAFDPTAAIPGLPGWECIPTPGHTPGHVSFFRGGDRVLISGDAIVTLNVNSVPGLLLGRQRLSGPPWYTSWNRRSAEASIVTLARHGPLVLAPGHGFPMSGAGTPQVLLSFAEGHARHAP